MTDLPTCALLDDYQDAAMPSADWSALEGRVRLERFDRPFASEDAAAEALAGCEIVVAMRERTPFPKSLLERLPRLELLVTTGMRNAAIDMESASSQGVMVCGTGSVGAPAAELAWAGMMAMLREIPRESANLRANGPWQTGLGGMVEGRRLGIVGLGKLGRRVAGYGRAFGMEVCGWTRTNLDERAAEMGIEPVSLEDLFAGSDVVMVQLALNEGTQGLVSRALLERMKPGAIFVNTARGPIVDEDALVEVLRAGRIRGAVLDVFSEEPLPADHPFRTLPNVLATPHLGYVTEENYRAYYGGAVEAISSWLEGSPVRVLNG